MPLFGKSVDAGTMISLTEEGKRAIDREMVQQAKDYAILSELDQHSPQSLAALSKVTGLNIMALKREAERLKRQGMIKALDFSER